MLSALELDIRPGIGLGMFELGTSLWTILETIRKLQHMFPQVDVKYDPDFSATTPIILHLRPHLDLLFSGYHQRLHTICVRKLRVPHPPVILRYEDAILSSTENVLRRLNVKRTFGPTYPGDDLRYPGIIFSFEDDGLTEGLKGTKGQAEDKMQEVKRVLVSQKPREGDVHDALDEVAECPVMAGDISRAIAKIHNGIFLHFYQSPGPPIQVRIGETTAQDLFVDLGPPVQIHYKDDERMRIHSSQSSEEVEPCYFYNYFHLGIDFLISGNTHTIRKIILHSNIPGSPLFQRYKRCPWEIEGRPEDDEDDTPPRTHFFERYETINHFLKLGEQAPSMPLDRTDDEDTLTLPSATTRLLGYDGIVLEVTEASQVVAVILF